ncbi:hypothetical protein ACSYDW_14230 [Paeniglutamicibacter sp. R2-26]|uniref:hypothetical protein n=1 Tax=Paeniglutamicibacter sp. R2-26 TaxID=3144417 RepID=UPI003EE6274D
MVHSAMGWIVDHDAQDVTAVASSPDLLRPYLDIICHVARVLDGIRAETFADTGVPTALAHGPARYRGHNFR